MDRPAWSLLSTTEIRSALEQLHASGVPAVSGMLDVHQWTDFSSDSTVHLLSAYPAAQFRQLGCGPAAAPTILSMPLDQFPQQLQSPRALRRKLLAVANDESDLGDLAVSGNRIWLVVAQSDWLAAAGLHFSQEVEWKPAAPVSLVVNVASMRLDAIIARLFSVGRSEANTAITHGFVFVDFKQQLKPARCVSAGTVLVFRGMGRVELLDAQVNSRSGRIRLSYLSWPV